MRKKKASLLRNFYCGDSAFITNYQFVAVLDMCALNWLLRDYINYFDGNELDVLSSQV
jgi:hypothetical protein